MHLAKGLEFKCVVVMARDDDVVPPQQRIESVVVISIEGRPRLTAGRTIRYGLP